LNDLPRIKPTEWGRPAPVSCSRGPQARSLYLSLFQILRVVGVHHFVWAEIALQLAGKVICRHAAFVHVEGEDAVNDLPPGSSLAVM
jgi:hypothetical protein